MTFLTEPLNCICILFFEMEVVEGCMLCCVVCYVQKVCDVLHIV